jgi:hypothetical protein
LRSHRCGFRLLGSEAYSSLGDLDLRNEGFGQRGQLHCRARSGGVPFRRLYTLDFRKNEFERRDRLYQRARPHRNDGALFGFRYAFDFRIGGLSRRDLLHG